jgi:hypothetical protein
MKEHLINLLFEEYKLNCFIDKLNSIGVNVDKLEVKNHEVVMDIIGFPKDNTLDFYKNPEKHPECDRNNLPDDFFCRDWLDNRLFKLMTELNSKQDIVLTNDGLKITDNQDESRIKSELSRYIDWLYQEFNDLDKE